MKPRNKLDRQVFALHKKLPKITNKHRKWAYKKLFTFHAWKTAHLATCFECGHSWREDTIIRSEKFDIKCPKCRRKLKIAESRKHTSHEIEYFKVYSVSEDFQVIRMFQVHKYCSKGYDASYRCEEIYQHWLRKDCMLVTIARSHNSMGINFTENIQWHYNQPMEIKNSGRDWYYTYTETIYPNPEFLPIFLRNGFSGNFHEFDDVYFFKTLLTNSRFETLLKAGQYGLMIEITHTYNDRTIRYWQQIKTCIRHKYIVIDPPSWFDHIELLEFFKMDTHNPKYICPADFYREHQILTNRKTRILERKRIIEKRKKEYNDMLYRKAKKKLLDLKFSDGTITIVPLQNVSDFKTEQKVMKHCVYSSKYYLKDTSLILSARIDDIRLETIEVTLQDFKVSQCMGYLHGQTEYHDKILALMKKNLPKLKRSFEKAKQRVKTNVKKAVTAA